MKKQKSVWKILSGAAFVVAFVMLCIGFDKMLSYSNGEYPSYTYHNAYVGGDAYNYIINGNYATAFFVLATLFSIIGIGFLLVNYLSSIDKKLAGSKSDAEETSDKLPEEVEPKLCTEDDAAPLEESLQEERE